MAAKTRKLKEAGLLEDQDARRYGTILTNKNTQPATHTKPASAVSGIQAGHTYQSTSIRPGSSFPDFL